MENKELNNIAEAYCIGNIAYYNQLSERYVTIPAIRKAAVLWSVAWSECLIDIQEKDAAQ
jgi:hypothetical protein